MARPSTIDWPSLHVGAARKQARGANHDMRTEVTIPSPGGGRQENREERERILALRFRSVAKIAKDARHLFIQHPVRRLHPGRIRVGFVPRCDIGLGFSTQFSVHIICRSLARAAACHGGCCWGLVEKMAKGAQFVLHLITHFLLELGACPSSWGAPSQQDRACPSS